MTAKPSWERQSLERPVCGDCLTNPTEEETAQTTEKLPQDSGTRLQLTEMAGAPVLNALHSLISSPYFTWEDVQ